MIRTFFFIMSGISLMVHANFHREVASVRVGSTLCSQELQYIQQRTPIITKALQTLVPSCSFEGKEIPTIAIACSGGGYRALLYSLGGLVGAELSGLLDATMYVLGLSGSTWSISSWQQSNKMLSEIKEELITIATQGLTNGLNFSDMILIEHRFLCKEHYHQPLGVVDLYGALLASTLFEDYGMHKQMLHLSNQAQRVSTGAVPLPIYTAMRADLPDATSESMWYEFTPYEIGAPWLQCYVPSWAFGRAFDQGKSLDFAPEQSLGTLLATFGYAIGVTVSELVAQLQLSGKLQFSIEWAESFINHLNGNNIGNDRITCAQYNNFTVNIPQSPIAHLPTLAIADAGIRCNLPYFPISGERAERKADIIIFLDASLDIGPELLTAYQYAHGHTLHFPVIPSEISLLQKTAVQVFQDATSPDTPIIIYIPCVSDQAALAYGMQNPEYAQQIMLLDMFSVEDCIAHGDCGTFNFSYTPLDAQRVELLGELHMNYAMPHIVQAISQWMENHR